MNGLQRSYNNRFQPNSYERNNADGPAAVNPAATQLASVKGNPGFAAQFDIQVLLKYYTLVDATGVFTGSTAAAVAAAVPALATQGAFFLFGNSDFAAGFKKSIAQFPLSGGWGYGDPGIYGTAPIQINTSFIDATVKAQLQRGDLVIPIFSDQGATTYVMLVIVRCTQVGYGTLLDSLNSDMFIMNMIRYIESDTSTVGLAQYNNNIALMKQSLFGKAELDFVSPNSFKMPEQFQPGIIDIPIKTPVDKQKILGSYVNYDVIVNQWSLFVEYVEKRSF